MTKARRVAWDWGIVLYAAGYVGALLTLAAFFMKDTVRLRQLALGSNVAFALFALDMHLYPTLALNLALIPLNVVRLAQLQRERRLIQRALEASEVSPDWLTPFMDRRRFPAGTVLFRRDDPADRLYFLARGRLVLEELGVELAPGALLGEIGIFSPHGKRTQTVRALADITVYELRRDEVLALYRRDPGFGIYLVRLITARLVEDLERVTRFPGSPPVDASPPAAPS